MARHSPTSGEIAIIGIFIYASLIVAKRTGRHKWYLPFLFVNAVSMTLQIIALIMLLTLLSTRYADGKMLQAMLQYSSGTRVPQPYLIGL
ncbi:hypothetical protein AAVH_23723 [Aphelenchoides avenae]|nr:hypothetical protein AAVH_23723 [Aphelenchus avenae]